ncbi:TPA: hypothetical protein ACGCQS_000969 [Legionella pneumophila]|nr:hypothetical protein [Legionella pneumophila]HAT8183692.1 hypothetical protein [Legionella pneumophila]HBD9332839.1 hypothetical protein [Legionella pneumophila]
MCQINVWIKKIYRWLKSIVFKHKIPTDMEILITIYTEYLGDFLNFNTENKNREEKIYIPIDIKKIAKTLKTDEELIFGRIYHYLNKKHSYDKTPLFEISMGKDRHVIQFPLMVSILADLLADHKRFKTSIWLSIGALILSVISIIVSLA